VSLCEKGIECVKKVTSRDTSRTDIGTLDGEMTTHASAIVEIITQKYLQGTQKNRTFL
jgi:hypothetical protein